ncbi:MAG: Translation initiation factor IF-2, partial [Candidatus Levybacteria bacterium GW2011_GWC2_40_7]
NSLGEHIKEASVGDAVEILGFDKVPDVGIVFTKGGKAEAPVSVREESIPPQNPEGIVSLTLAAETQGALEAIVSALPTGAKLVSKKTGEITTADVLFAKSIGAIVLGFNVKIRPEVLKLAATEKVLVKNYKLIYEMLSEINDVIEGKELSMQEEIYGVAKILARFPYEKTEVLGIAVTDGRVAKGDKARIVRGDEVVGEARITSLRQGKEQISKVETGEEAGIIITPFLDFTIGDMVICHG